MKPVGRIAGEFASMAAAARAIREHHEGDELLPAVLRRIRTTDDARHFYSAWSGAPFLLNPSISAWLSPRFGEAPQATLLIVAPDAVLLRDGSQVHPVLTAAGPACAGRPCDLRAQHELPRWTACPLRIDDLRGN